MSRREVSRHAERIVRSAMSGSVDRVREAAGAAAADGVHTEGAFWRLISENARKIKEWDILLAGLYGAPEMRRHPRFLELAATADWPKESRVSQHLPYPHIADMSRRMADLGYVPPDVVSRVSALSARFPEMDALDRYLRKNSKYAFRTLVTDPNALKAFLRTVHAWENVYGRVPGNSAVKQIHRILPDLLTHYRILGGDFEQFLARTSDVPTFAKELRKDVTQFAEHAGISRFVVEPEDYVHIPRLLGYFKDFKTSLSRLPPLPSDLFDYKFGHISPNLARDAVDLRNYLRSVRIIVPLFDPHPLLQQLDDAALSEGLSGRTDPFSSLLRSAYQKVSRGEVHRLTREELRAVSKKHTAEGLGLSETRRLLQKIVERHATSSGILALAGTVPEHFGAMAVSGSCYSPGHNHYTLGAVGSTGGPSLVFYVKHPVTGEALAHQVYNLHVGANGRHFFVPNDVYGTDNIHLSKITSRLLSEFGMPVYHGHELPKGARPAPSRHDIRDFYSDILGDPKKFPAHRRR
ncbi:MAG: hypothetical protein GXN93_01595 [Candidatus Diapherotrites archaeon]|nr:hypothetical protein [Candidatus Diapherotrites archaeon]